MLKKHIKLKRKNKGQSTVEYIILVAAILAALIVFLKPGGVFQTAFNSALTTGTNGMENMAGRLSTSR
jgi:uncharacterized protein (UPF0333 family)